jgi:hypothetical protein
LPPSPSIPRNLHVAPTQPKPPASPIAPVGYAVSSATPIPRRPIRTPVVS